MDDSSLERLTKVRFEVYGDGRLLAQSPALGADDAPFTLEASVADVEIVDLVAHEIGKGSAPAIVTWGEAALRH
jgi:alpha-galactosidase